jgi:hypothetical protein
MTPAAPQTVALQEPELCCGHFFEQAAEPADKIVRGEQVQTRGS